MVDFLLREWAPIARSPRSHFLVVLAVGTLLTPAVWAVTSSIHSAWISELQSRVEDRNERIAGLEYDNAQLTARISAFEPELLRIDDLKRELDSLRGIRQRVETLEKQIISDALVGSDSDLSIFSGPGEMPLGSADPFTQNGWDIQPADEPLFWGATTLDQWIAQGGPSSETLFIEAKSATPPVIFRPSSTEGLAILEEALERADIPFRKVPSQGANSELWVQRSNVEWLFEP